MPAPAGAPEPPRRRSERTGPGGWENRPASFNVSTATPFFCGRRLAEEIIDPTSQSLYPHHRHNRWLILIAAFKISQAVLFIAIGVGALRLLHKDVADVLQQLFDHLRFHQESRVVNFVLEHAYVINDRVLRRIGAVVFIYAGLDLIEGIGLYLEKTWAEYFTLCITASFLPWEVFEIVRKITWIRTSLLVVNTLVFLYLLKIVIERGKGRSGLNAK